MANLSHLPLNRRNKETRYKETAHDFPTSESENGLILKMTIAGLEQVAQKPANTSKPVVTFIVGQPAAGKSRMIERLQQERPGVMIDSDEIRQMHPRVDEIVAHDPVRWDVLANAPVGYVVPRVLDWARGEGYNVYLENTLTNPDQVRQTIDEFRQAGYKVELAVIAVPEIMSRISIGIRYARGLHRHDGRPRWTALAAHDTAYQAIPDGVSQLAGAADTVSVWNRMGKLWEGKGDRAAEALAVLDAERHRTLHPAEEEDFVFETASMMDDVYTLAEGDIIVETLLDRVEADLQEAGLHQRVMETVPMVAWTDKGRAVRRQPPPESNDGGRHNGRTRGPTL